MPSPSLSLLHRELGDLNLEPDVQAVFLACFLADEGYFGCSGEELDAASSDFLKRTKCPPDVWLTFLCTATDELLVRDASKRPRFEAYIKAQAAEFRASVTPPEPAPKEHVVSLTITADEAQRIGTLLSTRVQKGVAIGAVFLNWETAVSGLQDRVEVQLVNCEGGPALVGYRRRDHRVIEGTPPVYSLTEGLTFARHSPKICVRFDLK